MNFDGQGNPERRNRSPGYRDGASPSVGHGQREEFAPEAAFSAAASAEPRALPEAAPAPDARIGTRVSVAPTDYGTDPVTGTLVAVTASRCIVARDTERFGRVHVHFPLRGFAIAEA
jgi:hypothetical protein